MEKARVYIHDTHGITTAGFIFDNNGNLEIWQCWKRFTEEATLDSHIVVALRDFLNEVLPNEKIGIS